MTEEIIVRKKGLIGLREAADYLDTSQQYLSKLLNEESMGTHPIADYFRHYAGRWRTTYALLDEYFTNGKIVGTKHFTSEKGNNVG